MNDQARPLERGTAARYASWFRALADPTRVQIVSLLAVSDGPLTVGAITDAVDVGQSTVSAHLKVLAGVGFVLAERRGTSVRFHPDPQIPPVTLTLTGGARWVAEYYPMEEITELPEPVTSGCVSGGTHISTLWRLTWRKSLTASWTG